MPERAGSSTPPLASVPAPLLDVVASPSVGSTLTSPTTPSSQPPAPSQPNLLQAPVTVGLLNGIGGATTQALIHWGDLAVWAVGCKSAGWRLFLCSFPYTFRYNFFAYAGFAVQTPTHHALGPATMVRQRPVSPTRRRPRLRQRRALKSHLVTALPAKVPSGVPRAWR